MKPVNYKEIKPLFLVFGYATTAYILCKMFYYFCGFTSMEVLFKYSITSLFIIFTVFALIIISLLLLVKNKNFDSVGYAFMALTSLKIGVLLFWARPIIKSTTDHAKFEKGNFFIIFALFLAIETIVAIRILNNKQ